MFRLDRIASEKEAGLAIDDEHKSKKDDLSPAIYESRCLK